MHHTLHFKNPLLKWDFALLGGVSTKWANFWCLPTTWEATLQQEMSLCGSDICLGSCIFVPSANTLFSLPTQHNQSSIITCSVVATLHQIFTLWPNHPSMDHNVLHIFSMSSSSVKTSKVLLSSSFCTTIGPTVVWWYTNQVMMSVFINAVDNACPLSNSILKAMALWLLSPIGIRGMLTVDDVNILTISEFKLIETIKKYILQLFISSYSKCTDTDAIQTDESIAQ